MSAQDRIVEAAMDVFSQHGFRRSSMEQVAQAAGLTRQALYHHFPTKEALFRAVVEALHEGAFAAEVEGGRASEAAGGSLADSLVAQVEARVRYIVDCVETSPFADELLSEHQHQTRDLYENFLNHNLELRETTIARFVARDGLELRNGATPHDLARSIQFAIAGYDALSRDPGRLQDLLRVVRLLAAGGVASKH